MKIDQEIRNFRMSGNVTFAPIADPTSPPTAALAGAGAGNLSNMTFWYSYTWITKDGETNGTPFQIGENFVTVTNNAADGQVDVSGILNGPTGATGKRIYRNRYPLDTTGGYNGGYEVYLVGQINDNTTTTFRDNVANSLLLTRLIHFNSTAGQIKQGGVDHAYFGPQGGFVPMLYAGNAGTSGFTEFPTINTGLMLHQELTGPNATGQGDEDVAVFSNIRGATTATGTIFTDNLTSIFHLRGDSDSVMSIAGTTAALSLLEGDGIYGQAYGYRSTTNAFQGTFTDAALSYRSDMLQGGTFSGNMFGFRHQFQGFGGGSVPQHHGIDILSPTGASVITNNVAIHVEDQTGATNNWSWKSGLGLFEVGDTMLLHGHLTGQPLTLDGWAVTNGNITLNPGNVAGGNSGVVINTPRLDNPGLRIRDAAGTTTGNAFTIAQNDDTIYFQVRGGTDASSPGWVIIRGNILPKVDLGSDVGTPSFRFNNGYFNTLNFTDLTLTGNLWVKTDVAFGTKSVLHTTNYYGGALTVETFGNISNETSSTSTQTNFFSQFVDNIGAPEGFTRKQAGYFNMESKGSGNSDATLLGLEAQASHVGTGTLGIAEGMRGLVEIKSTGTVSDAIGSQGNIILDGAGIITDGDAVRAAGLLVGGSVSTFNLFHTDLEIIDTVITDMNGLKIDSIVFGSGGVTNGRGIFINTVLGTTIRRGIETNIGDNLFKTHGAAISPLRLQGAASQTASLLKFETDAAASILTVEADGGILGQASFPLTLRGAASSNGNITLNPGAVAGAASVFINSPRLDLAGLIIVDASGTTTGNSFEVRKNDGTVNFQIRGGTDATSPGWGIIRGNFVPKTTLTYELGSGPSASDLAWNKLWTKDINLTGQVDFAGANVMTFAPTTIKGAASGNGNITLIPGNVAANSFVSITSVRVDTPGLVITDASGVSTGPSFIIRDNSNVEYFRVYGGTYAAFPGLVGIRGDVVPITNNAFDLGHTAGGDLRWRKLNIVDIDMSGTFTGTIAGIAPVVDTTAIVKGSADATKLLRFEVDGFTTATTRVATPPNADFAMAGINIAQTFSALQTFGDLTATGTVTTSGIVSLGGAVGFSSNLIPSVDATYNLGDATHRMAVVRATTLISGGTGGLHLLVGSDDAVLTAGVTAGTLYFDVSHGIAPTSSGLNFGGDGTGSNPGRFGKLWFVDADLSGDLLLGSASEVHFGGTLTFFGNPTQIRGATSSNGNITLAPGDVAGGNSSVFINNPRLDNAALVIKDASGTTTGNSFIITKNDGTIYFQVRGGTGSGDAGWVVTRGNIVPKTDLTYTLGDPGTTLRWLDVHSQYLDLIPIAVGSLTTCNSGAKGKIAFVNDALTPVALAAVVGGGAVGVPVYCDGTSWKVS